jgi:hypothetical protein
MKKYQTKKQVTHNFKSRILPYIIKRFGKKDKIAIRCAWLDYVESLRADDEISEHQADNWENPWAE